MQIHILRENWALYGAHKNMMQDREMIKNFFLKKGFTPSFYSYRGYSSTNNLLIDKTNLRRQTTNLSWNLKLSQVFFLSAMVISAM